MPTIPQLPPAASVTAADEIPISQGGSAMSMAVGTLLAGTQPAIITPSGSLMGGSVPEAVAPSQSISEQALF